MEQIRNVISEIEKLFPPSTQESYDNSGLIIGNKNDKIHGVLLTIDVNESVVDEAIQKKCNLIIAHHPIIFHPIKKITGSNYIEKTIIKAIKNDISIYGAHTSVDNNYEGINKIICDKLGLKNLKIISPMENLLLKLIVFVPKSHVEKVRAAIFEAGAGHIGNYDSCSFNVDGKGTFRATENAKPFVGEKWKLHFEPETKIETVFPAFIKSQVISAMIAAHPYEEVAYDIFKIENVHSKFGSGIIGELEEPEEEKSFLYKIKKNLNVECLKYSELKNKKVKTVAVCSGACHFLINKAASLGADMFISSEMKYDQYISAQKKIVVVDAGHYETEIFIKKLFYDILTKKFTNFAVKFSENFNNPVNYL